MEPEVDPAGPERQPLLRGAHRRALRPRHDPDGADPDAALSPLTEVTADQPIATFTDATGTLVGFRTPDYAQGVGITGSTSIS